MAEIVKLDDPKRWAAVHLLRDDGYDEYYEYATDMDEVTKLFRKFKGQVECVLSGVEVVDSRDFVTKLVAKTETTVIVDPKGSIQVSLPSGESLRAKEVQSHKYSFTDPRESKEYLNYIDAESFSHMNTEDIPNNWDYGLTPEQLSVLQRPPHVRVTRVRVFPTVFMKLPDDLYDFARVFTLEIGVSPASEYYYGYGSDTKQALRVLQITPRV